MSGRVVWTQRRDGFGRVRYEVHEGGTYLGSITQERAEGALVYESFHAGTGEARAFSGPVDDRSLLAAALGAAKRFALSGEVL